MSTPKNFKHAFETTQQAIRNDPSQGLASFTAESRQVEGLRSQINIRQFTLNVDEPESLGGTDQGPNPVELVLAGLATCQEITWRLHADRLGVPLKGVSVKAAGEIDLRGFFAVDNQVRPGFSQVTLDVTIDSDAPEAELQRLQKTVDDHCPVLDLLRATTPVSARLVKAGQATGGQERAEGRSADRSAEALAAIQA